MASKQASEVVQVGARQVRRVPVDFDWPIGRVWKGYLPPDGLGDDALDAWQPTEYPPGGDGWQLWETTTEGSPVSPVFTTAEQLATWCAENETAFSDLTMTAAEWLAAMQASSEASKQATPGRGGQPLELSLADQLALGRVLHRYLADPGEFGWANVVEMNDDTYLSIEGLFAIRRDDELAAVQRALGQA